MNCICPLPLKFISLFKSHGRKLFSYLLFTPSWLLKQVFSLRWNSVQSDAPMIAFIFCNRPIKVTNKFLRWQVITGSSCGKTHTSWLRVSRQRQQFQLRSAALEHYSSRPTASSLPVRETDTQYDDFLITTAWTEKQKVLSFGDVERCSNS